MTVASYSAAKNEMAQAVHLKLQAEAPTIVGYVPEMRYPGVVEPSLPTTPIWGRFSIETVIQEQRSLQADGPEKRRHTAVGLVYVQLFAPKDIADATAKMESLSTAVKSAFTRRSLSGNIVFRRARIRELPAEERYNRLNVMAEFEYDELV